MRLAGAVFDLDGTLVDSMNLWDRVPGMLVRGFGKEPAPDLAARLAEMDLPEAAQYLIDNHLTVAELDPQALPKTPRRPSAAARH